MSTHLTTWRNYRTQGPTGLARANWSEPFVEQDKKQLWQAFVIH